MNMHGTQPNLDPEMTATVESIGLGAESAPATPAPAAASAMPAASATMDWRHAEGLGHRTERLRLLRRLLQRERELEAARRLSEALFQHTHVDGLLKQALRTALDVVDAEAGSVLLADPKSKQLVFHHSMGEKAVPARTAIPWHEGIAGAVFQSGKAEVIPDVKRDSRHFAGIDLQTGYNTRDMITLPLKRWNGVPIGVLNVLNKRQGRLDENDLSVLTIICALTATSIEQARLLEEPKLAAAVHLLGDIGHDVKNMLTPVVMCALHPAKRT